MYSHTSTVLLEWKHFFAIMNGELTPRLDGCNLTVAEVVAVSR